jgi:hypothetical protein
MKRRNTRNGKSPVRTRNTRRRNRVGSNRKSRRGGQSTGLADVTSTLKVGDLHPSLVAVVRHYLSSTWHSSGFLFVLPFRWDLHRMHTNLRFFFFCAYECHDHCSPFLGATGTEGIPSKWKWKHLQTMGWEYDTSHKLYNYLYLCPNVHKGEGEMGYDMFSNLDAGKFWFFDMYFFGGTFNGTFDGTF